MANSGRISSATEPWDCVVLGAGAAGLFCAGRAAARGARVLVLEHRDAPGEKIRISGGGRCNFTNLRTRPENFISANRHFMKSALARFSPQDFCALLEARGIPYHEKTLGQLFCDRSARDVIDLLLDELARAGAALRLGVAVGEIARGADGFEIAVEREGRRSLLRARSLVVATGGKSIPKIGASGIGYRIAESFDLSVVETRPGLVPLTFTDETLTMAQALSGVSVEGAVRSGKTAFEEALLFTHRGLSGPAILQISSYWREGGEIEVDLAPGFDVFGLLQAARAQSPKRGAASVLAERLPKRLAEARAGRSRALGPCSDKDLRAIDASVRRWRLIPAGSEGYRTAEVTLGGVDTRGLESGTMEAKAVPGLFFIGEVVDVTGWLGGYNFQWAWASAHAAGTAIADRFAGA